MNAVVHHVKMVQHALMETIPTVATVGQALMERSVKVMYILNTKQIKSSFLY